MSNFLVFPAAVLLFLIEGLTTAIAAPKDNTWYEIRAKHSEQCLATLNRGLHNGANVVQGRACGDTHFKWKLIPVGENYYNIKVMHSGQYLAVLNASQKNGASVVQGTARAGTHFKWRLIPVRNGYYKIKVKHSEQCLAVLNGSKGNGANVVQGEACNSGDHFLWHFTPVIP